MQNLEVAAASVCNRIGQTQANLQSMQTWTARAAEQGAQLILFPELNMSGHTLAPVAAEIAEPVPGPITEQVIELAARQQMIICFGILERAGCARALHARPGQRGRRDWQAV